MRRLWDWLICSVYQQFEEVRWPLLWTVVTLLLPVVLGLNMTRVPASYYPFALIGFPVLIGLSVKMTIWQWGRLRQHILTMAKEGIEKGEISREDINRAPGWFRAWLDRDPSGRGHLGNIHAPNSLSPDKILAHCVRCWGTGYFAPTGPFICPGCSNNQQRLHQCVGCGSSLFLDAGSPPVCSECGGTSPQERRLRYNEFLELQRRST